MLILGVMNLTEIIDYEFIQAFSCFRTFIDEYYDKYRPVKLKYLILQLENIDKFKIVILCKFDKSFIIFSLMASSVYVINEFILTYKVQDTANWVFQIALL